MKNHEFQIKSRKRVKDFAEVFTADREVNAMLDLLPEITIGQTFLEPSCGNGAFLKEVIRRKLEMCRNYDEVLIAYGSVFGIDIQEDNVKESRSSMLSMLPNEFRDVFLIIDLNAILERNIVCGNFLESDSVWFLLG